MSVARPIFTVVSTTVFVASLGVGLLLADPVVLQPYRFNHAVHTAKADCTLCHRGARSRRDAGLPDLGTCAECHATAPGKSPASADVELWKRVREGQAPRWNRLYRVPSHVFFSHRRHTQVAGIDCAECHGDMKARRSPPQRALRALRMRDCLGCHEREQVTVDCTTCHR